ncbi:hypothetical protein BHE90_017647, partial [Fusarium euwallaceae]
MEFESLEALDWLLVQDGWTDSPIVGISPCSVVSGVDLDDCSAGGVDDDTQKPGEAGTVSPWKWDHVSCGGSSSEGVSPLHIMSPEGDALDAFSDVDCQELELLDYQMVEPSAFFSSLAEPGY